jgi:hypothetical protein
MLREVVGDEPEWEGLLEVAEVELGSAAMDYAEAVPHYSLASRDAESFGL